MRNVFLLFNRFKFILVVEVDIPDSLANTITKRAQRFELQNTDFVLMKKRKSSYVRGTKKRRCIYFAALLQ